MTVGRQSVEGSCSLQLPVFVLPLSPDLHEFQINDNLWFVLVSFNSKRVIIDWAKDPQRRNCPGLGLFTSKRMEDIVFEDLKIKLGYPYLYCHQGNCEHLIIFTDLRYIIITYRT